MRNLGLWCQKHWVGISLGLFSVIFFFIYLFLYLPLPRTENLIFNQPDEMANYAFVKEWALKGEVGIVEPLTTFSLNQVHPRSMTVVEGRLVPIGFPGFIAILTSFVQPGVWLFGDKIFNWLVISLTPLVAALSSILLYGISRSLGLTKGAALVTGLGLLVLPPWWYYASRPLQANTLFVFFVLAGLWAALRKNERLSRFFLIGLSFGLALYVRPSEWVWVFGLIGVLGYFNRSVLHWKQVVFFGFGSGLMALIFFLTQFAFYGSWLGSGYVRPGADGAAGLITAGPQGIYWLQALFLPFGFDGLAIVKTAYHYGLKLFLPWTVAVVIGFAFLCAQSKDQKVLFKYALGLMGLGLWLVLYYGPWQFTDNLAGQVSIGSSQVRYFLPLFVLALPLLGYLISRLWTWKWSGKVTVLLIVLALLSASVKAVYFKFEGLAPIKQTVAEYYEHRAAITDRTPEESIIVTRYADKYLFPERPVIATADTLDGEAGIEQLLKQGALLYWFDYYNFAFEERLAQKGIGIDKPLLGWENLELREFYLIK